MNTKEKRNFIKRINEEKIFLFDINKFIEVQTQIAENLPAKGSKTERLDKMILQTLEELYEFDIEKASISKIEEAIDCLMYLGSTLYYFDFTSCSPFFVFICDSKVSSEDIFKEVSMNLLSIRRLFPERKWHKKIDPTTIVEDRIKISESIILECMKKIIKYLISIISDSKIELEKINLLITNKQNYILSLNKTTDEENYKPTYEMDYIDRNMRTSYFES